MKLKVKDTSVLLIVTGILLLAGLAQAQESARVSVDTSQCVEREVAIVLRSTGSVHYSEADEGRVVSIVKVKDCGNALVMDPPSSTPPTPVAPAPAPIPGMRYCPPGMTDCIAP